METNGIFSDIDITNTLKYQGSIILNPALTILDTHFEDQGNYYCYGENDVDCKNSSFTVLTVFGGKCNLYSYQHTLLGHLHHKGRKVASGETC